VEVLGLVMTVRAHLPPKSDNRSRELDRGDASAGRGEAAR